MAPSTRIKDYRSENRLFASRAIQSIIFVLVLLIILVMYDARTRLSDQVVTEVRSHFGDKVCRTVVPRSVRLSEAPSYGQPITVFDPTSRGALAYRELSRPTPVSSYVAVTDFEGVLHLVSQVDGEFVGRVSVDGDGARADMLADGNRLYVFTNSGKLIAYEVSARD